MLEDVRLVLHVPGPLPDLNTFLDEKARSRQQPDALGRRPNLYAKAKKEWHGYIRALLPATARQLPPSAFTFVWRELDRRRDPDGFTAGGRKLIFDALQRAGVLAGDGWRCVLDFRDHWFVHERPGLTLVVAERVLPERADAEAFLAAAPPPRARAVPILRPPSRREKAAVMRELLRRPGAKVM